MRKRGTARKRGMAPFSQTFREKGAVTLFLVFVLLCLRALVAQTPDEFGIQETWHVKGDELGLGLFFREHRDPKNDDEREKVDDALGEVSSH